MTHSFENADFDATGPSVSTRESVDALRRRLKRANRAGRLKALALVAPLLLFLTLTFLLPIGLLLARSVDNREIGQVLPGTVSQLSRWDSTSVPGDDAFRALAADLRAAPRERLAEVGKRLNYYSSGFRSLLTKTAREAENVAPENAREQLVAISSKWNELSTWQVIKEASPSVTDYYLLKAVDLTKDADGRIVHAADDAIYIDVIIRTLLISLTVTILCVVLGYPLAYLLATTSPACSRWLMMLVLLPFWTSLLVRTTAWLVLLQSNGVVNSLLTWLGIVSAPLELVHNRVGVLIAMTHILLPFVVLPVHAVMMGIPDVYWRAASSLGAPAHKAFLRVYLPLTLPGVGAGALLVFILALGYYITPALVGGPKDQMLSYFVAYFVNQSSNWGMAAALAVVLLALVVCLYLTLVVAYGRSRMGAKA